ncbi:hypothetical protein [Pseudomonas sp. BW7P1]|uniref:hypothetical protein n=1 Tax=Pseudomonas TaxID=286 RepID=UPI0021AD57F6|nr:hypothetical protein [Pseudomonas sp. BW7P1]UWI61888.1 hypothetical protein NWV16_00370 [Pseudomonas sp. BW7P1]
MTRSVGLILPFVSLYGCAAQQVYNNHVYIENRCGQLLELKVFNSSNMHTLDRNMTAMAGSRALVASFVSYGEDVIEQVPNHYLLTINDTAGSKTINSSELKRHLIGAQKISEGTQREWTIREASICP